MTADAKLDPNPRAVMGGNKPPSSLELMQEALLELPEALTNSTATQRQKIEDMDKEAANLPQVLETAEQAETCTEFLSKARGLYTKLEAMRDEKKKPFWNAGKDVDKFFNDLKDRVTKIATQQKTSLKAWDDKVEAEQKRIAAEQAAEAKRIADEKARIAAEQEAAARAQREAAEKAKREAEERAAQARRDAEAAANAEARREAEARAAAAAKEIKQAEKAVVKADKEEAKAGAALDTAVRYEATANKLQEAADTGRGLGVSTISDSGATSSRRYDWKVERVPGEAVDFGELGPYFSEDEILKAANRAKAEYVAAVRDNPGNVPPAPSIKGLRFFQEKSVVTRG